MHRRRAVRSLLATGATVGLAGCNVFLGGQGETSDDDDTKKIFLINQRDRAVDLQLTITDTETGDTVYDETVRVPEDDPPTREVSLRSGTYELVANVVDGPRGTYRWELVVGRDSGLTIEIFADEVEIGMWMD